MVPTLFEFSEDLKIDDFPDLEMDEGEVFDSIELCLVSAEEPIGESPKGVSVPYKIAMDPNRPEYPKWLESEDVEHLRIKSYETWRKLKDEEWEKWKRGEIKAVPTAILRVNSDHEIHFWSCGDVQGHRRELEELGANRNGDEYLLVRICGSI